MAIYFSILACHLCGNSSGPFTCPYFWIVFDYGLALVLDQLSYSIGSNIVSAQLHLYPSYGFCSAFASAQLWLLLNYGFRAAMDLAQLWLLLSYGFIQLLMWMSFGFGSAKSSVQL